LPRPVLASPREANDIAALSLSLTSQGLCGKLVDGGTVIEASVTIGEIMLMNTTGARSAFALSLALHLSVVLLFLCLSRGPGRISEMVLAEVTLVAGSEGTGRSQAGGEGKAGEKGRARLRPEDRGGGGSPAREAAVSSAPDRTRTSEAGLTVNAAALTGATGQMEIRGEQHAAGMDGGTGGSSIAEGGGDGAQGTGSGRGGGEGHGRGGGRGEGLLGTGDYHHIRDMVMRNIEYPENARRMGMEGKVLLSFIVLENGATAEVRVLNGSGFKLLDQSARHSVEKTVIHKKVPYRVTVTLPVTYRLQ